VFDSRRPLPPPARPRAGRFCYACAGYAGLPRTGPAHQHHAATM